MKEICILCKERPVHIKKRQMCKNCYQGWRKTQGKLIDPMRYDYKAQFSKDLQRNKREIEFVKNFFEDKNWIHQPAQFKCNSFLYSPDFYDISRNVFIEVAGSRQAYHANKKKYEKFKELFPGIKLEIRTPDGDLLAEKPEGKMWEYQLNNL